MNVHEQQDAAEYLQMILNKVPEPEVFRGIKETSTTCSNCEHAYEEDTDFLSIPLSINENGNCDVQYAWEENLGVHVMSGDDQLYCVKCRSMRDMETINYIKKWPDILTLQLKRFEMKYIRNEIYYQKNECRVEIPLHNQFKQGSKNESSPEYELYAIIDHYGSFTGGHYVTLNKDLSGNWYHFNDHIVTQIRNTDYQYISSNSAHLLMYIKVSEMFKLRLKDEFQYLNDVFIEPHITEKPDSHISDKRPIMRNNMFEGQNIRTVLLKGDAGTGKTVTVQKFILDWAEDKSNTHIDYIFLIPFQKLNIIRETVKECSFMQLLQQCFENTEHLTLHDSDKIMLIFDGLNEFKLQNTKITDINKPASVSDLLTNLIKGNLLPNAQIWITSRPAAANQIPARFIDRVTEIQGFDDQQKQEYFRKSISDQRMSDKVISHIQKSPRVSSMCYLPDYCRIIAEIPEKMFSTGRDDFPKTLTQMYSRLLLAQIKLIRERKETIIALGRIAFELLVNRNSLFCYEDFKKCGIRDESDLIRSSIIKKIEDKSKRTSFCFVNHRTQEFLAALYVTEVINVNNPHQLRHLSSLKLEFGKENFTDYYVLENIMKNTLERQMDLFFCFLLGLTLKSSQRALKDLLKQRESSSSSSQLTVQHIKTLIVNSSPDADKCSLLFDALKELDERYLIQEIKTQLKSGLRLSPDQFSALVFVLLNSEEQLDEIKSQRSEEQDLIVRPVIKSSGEHEIYQCGIGVKACADLSSALRSNPSHLRELNLSGNALGDSGVKLLADLQCKLGKLDSALRSNPSHLRELDLSNNNITDSGVKQLSDLLKHPECKLEKLGLKSCRINEEGCADLSSALRSNPSHLRELDLSDNYITDSGVKQLSDLLKHPEFKLEKLWLRSCHVNEVSCADLSSALRSKPSHLRELDLSNNYFTDSGVKQLSDLLADSQFKLQKLGLRSCFISDRGCDDLSSALRSNPSHLRELDLSDNNITDSGVKQLSDLLKHPQCKLEKLWLRSCGISVRGCAVLSSALRSNPSHLRELDLSENYITDSGVKQLSDLLKHPECKLEKLWLRSCHISDRGCDVLSSALRSNPSHLRELDLSNNNITDSGVKQLSALLKHPECKLEKLWLKIINHSWSLRSRKTRANRRVTDADLETCFEKLIINN
ncbi:NACHT, LRR and PYD domains-containing protein 12-like [Sinocyclocheilus anshuiensis]|uniref:NACHT, LRR and PYD domains-containing protein 12-like n=1 Tax=Sinocyclocheilus anshuiensis TaxID=1608454 RepID=UPI0007B8F2CF|nr:PREDICTED: NACHT, LRR and PYD domains-containing protein 12-like [Sinocyclocheilus anshuiensis]